MPEPLTLAERTNYRETSRHADVLRFIEELQARRPRFRVESMGRSAFGQEMPVLVSADRRPERPTVLVLANIHAGEVEGKEAVLMLARDLPDRVLEGLTLLLVPDYNPDGNDRIDVRHRALNLEKLEGQIGPEGGVGTRTTGQGINLNRDYMKLEAPESQNLARLYARWWPHLTVDCHTTDGSLHGFELTYDTSHIPTPPCEWIRTEFLPEISRRLDRRTGLKTFFYGNFLDERDPTKGWMTYPHLPRYGSHYRGLTGRMDILLEAYSYIPFRDRVRVMVEILREIFDLAIERGSEILRRCAQEEARRPDPVGIAYGSPEKIGECEILAWDLESQLARRIPGRQRRVYRVPHFARFIPSKTVPRPAAYLVPGNLPGVIEKLREHNLRLKPVEKAFEVPGERYRIEGLSSADSPDVGDMKRQETVAACRIESGLIRGDPGDILVPTDQPLGTLAVYLLEPESDDGLVRWNFFDTMLRPGAIYPVCRLARVP